MEEVQEALDRGLQQEDHLSGGIENNEGDRATISWEEAKDILNNINKFNVKVQAVVEGHENAFESNTIANTIIDKSKDDIEVKLSIDTAFTGDQIIDVGQEVTYSFSAVPSREALELEKGESARGATITCKLPEGLIFKELTEGGSYDEKTRTATWKFEKFDGVRSFNLTAEIDKLPDGVFDRDIDVVLEGKYDGLAKISKSEPYNLKVHGTGFGLSQTSNISNGYIESNGEVTYAVTVKNLSSVQKSGTIIDTLPEELELVKYYYTKDGKTNEVKENGGNKVTLGIQLEPNTTRTIYIVAKPKRELKESKQITNKAVMKAAGMEDINANDLTLTLLAKGEKPGSQGGGQGTEDRNKIQNSRNSLDR